MSDVVEPDDRGNYSLFVKNVKEEEELILREDFGYFGLLGVHRPRESRNLFLRFPTKDDAESALKNMKAKYNVCAVERRNGSKRAYDKSSLNSAEDKIGGLQKFSASSPISTEVNDNVKTQECRGDIHKEERSFPRKDSVISNASDRNSSGRGQTGRKSKENDLTELQNGLNGISLAPPKSTRARHPENASSSDRNDYPSPLCGVNNSQRGGMPRLVPAKDLHNQSPSSAKLSLINELNSMPRLVPCGSRNGKGDCPTLYAAANLRKDLPVFSRELDIEMPKHANEMFIGNISEETTIEDIMEVFASLEPVHVTPLKYTDVKFHIPYRIVKFSSCKAVTYALKYYQHYYFHGKYWDLTRCSSLIEITKQSVSFK